MLRGLLSAAHDISEAGDGGGRIAVIPRFLLVPATACLSLLPSAAARLEANNSRILNLALCSCDFELPTEQRSRVAISRCS